MEVSGSGTGMYRCTVLVLSMLVHQSLSVREAPLISLLTDGQVFVLNHGQTLDVSCEFITDDFNMFDNPIVWKKFQRNEETQINIMGNIFDPFLATNRFEVTFDNLSPKYCLRLRIRNLTAEDSGNYTCEIRGRKSVILAHVTHYVFVRASVKLLYLTNDTSSSSSSSSLDVVRPPPPPPSDPRRRLLSRLVFIEDRPQPLRCWSAGGYPAPDIAVRLGDRDVTDRFGLASATLFYGKPGLRLIVTETERSTDGLRLTAADDGAALKCVATVPGLVPNVTEATVEVHYAPIITCSPTYAYVGQRDVMLRCEVRAKPEVMSLFWIIDVNGTTLSKGEVTDEHWSLVMVRDDDVMETQLHIRQLRLRNPRSYAVVAENSIATNSQMVQLLSIRSTAAPPHRFPPLPPSPQTTTASSSAAGHWRRNPMEGGRAADDDNQRYRLIVGHSTSNAAFLSPHPAFSFLRCLLAVATSTMATTALGANSRLVSRS